MEAGLTLREFSRRVQISAAYQSDIEHDRRRPPDAILKAMVVQLKDVDADFESLRQLDTRLDHELRVWANATPGVREMLRQVRDGGYDPREVLKEMARSKKKPKG